MYYAIKAVDNKIVDIIETDWNVCKKLVIGHDSLYKSFVNEDDAKDFIQRTTLEASFLNNAQEYLQGKTGATSIKAKYLFARYTDDVTGFTIAIYVTKRGERVTCKGYNLPKNKNLYYTLGGKYNLDKENGYEFIVESFKAVIEDTKEGIIEYLSSGVIKGVGVKKAEAIYDEFGPTTMQILEDTPEKLRFVKGFSKTLAESAIKQLNEAKGARDITRFLLKYGISQKYAMELYLERKHNAFSYIKEHPYELCRFPTVSFELADMIANDLGIPKNDNERMRICIYHVLNENEVNGNTGMEWQDFCSTVKATLGSEVSCDEILDFITTLCKRKALYVIKNEIDGSTKSFVYSSKMKNMEEECARNVMNVVHDKSAIEIKDIDDKIVSLEKYYKLKLDVKQKEAIKMALTGSPLTIITGEPGTGKTTVIKMIADLYESECNNIIFIAPTGRAARRMQEDSERVSHTIHSYLKIRDEKSKGYKEDRVYIKNSLVVGDEFSMADIYLADELFKSLVSGNRVVIVGDTHQLPSVGPGAVLRDMIDCGAIKTVRLDVIFRQQNDEKIKLNCKKINSGDGDIEAGSDFGIHEYSRMEDVKNLMIEIYLNRVKEYGLENVMMLCPYKEHTAGVKDMNKAIQDVVNPKADDKPEIQSKGEILRLGDLVMHVEKNTEDASNGDIGLITAIDDESRIVTVNINNKSIDYDRDDMKHLTLAYAMTVHKSQGSEASAVVFCLTKYHKAMLYRNLPYVAMSRGKKQVDFVGEIEALKEAAKHEIKNKRVTLFGKYLKYYSGNFVPI